MGAECPTYYCHKEVYKKGQGLTECNTQLTPRGFDRQVNFYYCEGCGTDWTMDAVLKHAQQMAKNPERMVRENL